MRINRDGTVIFSDAKVSISEEGLAGHSDKRVEWENEYYQQVFKRVVQYLRKIGWSVERNEDDYEQTVKQYGRKFANKYCWRSRDCSYGDLKGHLNISGRSIDFEMWQGINTPNRSDHGGRYEWRKEEVMPFLLRMRMERTRKKLRDYLMGVFTCYKFRDRSPKNTSVGFGRRTALESWIYHDKKSGHYKPELGHAIIHSESHNFTRDGIRLEHGKTKVYAFDRKGDPCYGVAYYDLNGNWAVHTGKHDYQTFYHNQLYGNVPDNLRVRSRRNVRVRRQRLEAEMAGAVKNMDFLRAHTIKNILFKPQEQLYVIKLNDGMYERSERCGYTSQLVDAGKYTWDEVCNLKWDDREVLPLGNAA